MQHQMRIIGGYYRSRKIDFPDDANKVRPTKDVVRQAIFNAIGNECNDYIVLDLFSGSGAYAIEAISRGAKRAYAIDNYDLSIKVIRDNIKNLNIKNINIVKSDYMDFLNSANNNNLKFDLIFIDPPYKMDIYMDVLNYLKDNDMLNDNAYIIMETDKHILLKELPDFTMKSYNYKDTNVYIYRSLK